MFYNLSFLFSLFSWILFNSENIKFHFSSFSCLLLEQFFLQICNKFENVKLFNLKFFQKIQNIFYFFQNFFFLLWQSRLLPLFQVTGFLLQISDCTV